MLCLYISCIFCIIFYIQLHTNIGNGRSLLAISCGLSFTHGNWIRVCCFRGWYVTEHTRSVTILTKKCKLSHSFMYCCRCILIWKYNSIILSKSAVSQISDHAVLNILMSGCKRYIKKNVN